MTLLLAAALLALMVYVPIGYAAVIEERREDALYRAYRPGDHRQWKRWHS